VDCLLSAAIFDAANRYVVARKPRAGRPEVANEVILWDDLGTT
jgi:hypothetical protein